MKQKKRRKRTRRDEEQQMRLTLVAALGIVILMIVLSAVLGQEKRQQRAVRQREEAKRAAEAEAAAAQLLEEVPTAEAESEAVPVPEAEPVTFTVSFTGDCTLGTDENFDYDTSFNAYYDSYGPDYFLKQVKSVFEADDLTVVNMEGTFTHSDERADKTFAFKADPDYVKILTSASVEAANLANNHSHDYGDQSYEDTKETLQNAGISYFGNGNLAVMDVKGVKVGLSGVYELAELTGCEEDMQNDIAKLKEQGAEVIIVEFHWGIEKESIPDENQTYLAHAAIDAGADLVVGAHPHVLQGIEMYQNKPIVYSMGNFCFGGNKNPSDKDTMIYQQTFTVAGNEVTESSMKILPCSLSSDSDYNTYQPVLLEGDEAERVLEKLQSRSNGIAETYGYEAAKITE